MHPGVHTVNSIKVKHYSQTAGYPNRVSRCFYAGEIEPIAMQLSGGRLLTPVQKLVSATIFPKAKRKLSPVTKFKSLKYLIAAGEASKTPPPTKTLQGTAQSVILMVRGEENGVSLRGQGYCCLHQAGGAG